MAARLLRCAIEEIAELHPNLFLEPHVVAFAAVASRYSPSPALFEVECRNLSSRWLGKNAACRLQVSWRDDTAKKAERLSATMQPRPTLELASLALALILETIRGEA